MKKEYVSPLMEEVRFETMDTLLGFSIVSPGDEGDPDVGVEVPLFTKKQG